MYKFICINKMTFIDRIIDSQTIETRLKIQYYYQILLLNFRL